MQPPKNNFPQGLGSPVGQSAVFVGGLSWATSEARLREFFCAAARQELGRDPGGGSVRWERAVAQNE